MAAPTVVILAAGAGTRMKSHTPKLLHGLCGRPLILWPVLAARAAGAARIVVVDGPGRPLADALAPHDVAVAIQREPRGTGDAARAAAEQVDPDAPVLVINGDAPLITASALAELLAAHEAAGAAATMLTMELEEPGAYGRVIRAADGTVERVVEAKGGGDATPEQLRIREVNAGIYAFDGSALLDALEQITPDNAQGEYYLPDTLPALRAAGRPIAGHRTDDATLTLGVNDRAELALVRAHAQARIHREHARNGVTIVDPASTLIEADVEIAADTTIEPSSFLRGSTRIGVDCTVGPLTTLIDCELGDGVRIVHSYAQGAALHDGASAGPFAYLRPGAVLRESAKAGTFVELKNSDVGAGSKVPHLSYIGDATIGERTNIGAATITANYDGVDKHRTTIGDDVRTSVDTTLVAPVTLGDRAYTAAGSVITEDVPPGALGVARSRQSNIEGYADRRSERAR